MSALLRAFLDLALLRSGPQALPASPLLLALAALGCAAASLALWPLAGQLQRGFGDMLFSTAVQMALDALALAIALRSAGRGARYLQSLCALYGANAVMALAALVPLGAARLANGDVASDGFIAVVSILLIGWGLAVLANILHHALEVSLAFALAIAFVCNFASLVMSRWLGVI